MQPQKMLFAILALGSFLALSACSSRAKALDNVEPETGLTVSQIYHMSTAEKPLPRYHIKPVVDNGYKQHHFTQFKTLENPSVPMYVFPHVALIGDEQIIKPGYTTAFFLYKQNQFALASEVY